MEDLSGKVQGWTSIKLNEHIFRLLCVCFFVLVLQKGKALYPKEIFFHYVGNNEFEIVEQNASVDSYDAFLNP